MKPRLPIEACLLLAAALLSWSRPALAWPAPPWDEDREPGWGSSAANNSAAAPDGSARLTLRLAAASREGGRRDYAGLVLLDLPTARWLGAGAPAASRKAKTAAPPRPQGEAPAAPPAAMPADGPRREVGPDPSSGSEAALLPELRAQDVRAALRAAAAQTGRDGGAGRLDDLATRARYSALLPELRLRLSRLVDESENLSPTAYDPARITLSGGASLWLEGRASWRLDRLLFADEEIQVEKLRRQLDEERVRREERVLGLLFAWQRAVLESFGPFESAPACRAARLRAEQLAAELDLVTGGWLGRWRRQQGFTPSPCACDETRCERGDGPGACRPPGTRGGARGGLAPEQARSMCFAPGGALLSQLTIEFWMDDGWYVGRLKEFPVVMSQGQTLDELKENIRDAYALVIADASSAADVPA